MLRPDHYEGMATGKAVVFGSLASTMVPPPPTTVAAWADEKRVVAAESGSSRPGKWSNDLTPFMIEVQEELSPSSPSPSVTLLKSHQIAGTEVAVNLFGYTVDEDPAPMLVVMSSLDQAKDFTSIKLDPTIAATPVLARKVRERKSRSSDASTASMKRFAGGFCRVTGANSSRGIQFISVKRVVGDEISDWPFDVDERGDPLTLVEKRLTAWENYGGKAFWLGTPGLKDSCRISAKYERSDQRVLYVACPHCGVYQSLEWGNLRVTDEGSGQAVHPRELRTHTARGGAFFVCQAHGCVIEHHHKKTMVADGVWLKTYAGEDKPPETVRPENLEDYRQRGRGGRPAGFRIWQAYTPFTTWDRMVSEFLEARGDPSREKVFSQQVLGEPYEESGEAPDHQLLHKMREEFPSGQIPPGGLILTGFTDVQANRLEWGVYAWSVGLRHGWLIAKGVIEGDPETDEVWRRHDEVIARQYPDGQGRDWKVEAWGVDTGYLSHVVYAYTRGRPALLACDGRGDRLHPYVGSPRKVDINHRGKRIPKGCVLYPIGTWQLKSWIYGKLRQTIDGPDSTGQWPNGALHFNLDCDEAYFQQLTAEFLKEVEHRDGRTTRMWVKRSGQPNEALDIAIGARAMAYHLGCDFWKTERWLELVAERGVSEVAQADLFALRGSPKSEDKTEKAKAGGKLAARLKRYNQGS